jgi:hypothetical protein
LTLGQNDLNPSEIRTRYRGLKPCLHGSDAHKLDDVATPFGDRFSWINGDLEFDSLRQACIDPGGRAFVGAEPPSSATPSQVLSEIQVLNAALAADADHSSQSRPRRHFNPCAFQSATIAAAASLSTILGQQQGRHPVDVG